MREILFRGRNENSTWIYGSLLVDKDTFDKNAFIYYICDIDGYSMEIFNTKTIGQYTGLTDKNGIKIFEGDIVNYNGSIHEVVFENRCYNARFGIVVEENETWSFGMSVPPYFMEVIGNIHDNPELLNK